MLLDLALPDGTGITVAQHLAATHPHAKIVVISGQSSTFVCPTALARCTHAVVHKAEAFDALQAILAGVSTREGGARWDGASSAPTARSRQPSRHLSQREREIDYNLTSPTGLDNFTGDYLPSSSFVAITAVPEPFTLALLGVGGVLACWAARSRGR